MQLLPQLGPQLDAFGLAKHNFPVEGLDSMLHGLSGQIGKVTAVLALTTQAEEVRVLSAVASRGVDETQPALTTPAVDGALQVVLVEALLLPGLVPIMVTAAIIVGSALRALEKPKWILWSYVASTVSVIVIGLPLTSHSGVLGATGSLFMSSLVAAIAMAWFFHRAPSEGRQDLE